MQGKIRIIGGHWRGRKLDVPDAPGLRPTGDRARETLFNWLGPRVIGAQCLDLFAGSGALGLEALSRGAASATLVERSPVVTQAIARQIASWPGADKARLVTADVLSWLDRAGETYSLVFVDPPFDQALQEDVLRGLIEHQLLGEGGLVYLESPASQPALDLSLFPGMTRWKTKTQGQVRLELLEFRVPG